MRLSKELGKRPFSLQPDWSKLPEHFEFEEGDFLPANQNEKESFISMTPSVSYWKDAWRRLKSNRVAMWSLVIFALIFVFAFIGPLLSPYNYDTQLRGMENLGLSFAHPFGTDAHGRDYMVRTMVGCRVSLVVGICASIIVLVIGTIYGSISGFAGGKIDNVMMRFLELIYSIPEVLVVILLSTVLKAPITNWCNSSDSALAHSVVIVGPGLISIFIAFGLLYWVTMARIIRGQVLMLKQQEYVTAAKALGAHSSLIVKRHILPNCIGQIIVTTFMQIPSAIFLESFLSFLGLGVSAPLTSLGSMSSDALGGIYTFPYRLIIPGLLLSVMVLTLNLFGDGLRDALDPRLKK